jgi:DNA-binding transcriptional MerR regulator
VTATEPPRNDEPETARRAKSAAAFRTTSEVAEELDLPTHVLRFWESKFAQVKPLKRGGGRRYYRPEDVELLRRIRQCLHQQGYTIRGVQKLLRDGALPRGAPTPWVLADDPGRASVALDPPAAPSPETLAGPAPTQQVPRTALEEVRRDLLQIRDLVDQLRASGEPEPA